MDEKIKELVYGFLGEEDLVVARRSLGKMREAADSFDFHLKILQTLAMAIQHRLAKLEAAAGAKKQLEAKNDPQD